MFPKTCAMMFSVMILMFAITGIVICDKYDDEYYDSRERILESSYHGLIKENETIVEITPLIKVDESKICDFHIIKKGYHDVPFQVNTFSNINCTRGNSLIELVNDLGILKAKKTLNCEKHKNYKFEIAAVFCDGSHSKSANVHISVIDINEYSPTFLQPSYVTEVDEGRLYQEIIRVEASDRDCTPLFGDVCKYEILTNDQPFTIDNEGSIRNTEPLSHIISHNHILSVIAYDCAMKQSAPVMVNIRVRRVCEARLMNIPERIDYYANSMESVSLFPKIHLELCDMECKNDNLIIESSVVLKTKHISFGCDRDITKCILAQKQHMPTTNDDDLIDLLPKNMEWTKDLLYDEGPDSIYHFDGQTGASVPSALLSHHDFALHPFSISTMFRHHNNADGGGDKHTKEHIVCSADDHKMNRHHMALFVRNCRLILLLRKNFNEGDLNIFSPAEWRWKIPQVCDNEWHHYTLTVDVPKVDLYIDGIKFITNIDDRHSNPEVIDDWPLHAAHGVNTTLTIGACYQGAETRMKHCFNGDISEIKIAMHKLLTPDEIKCGTMCAEHLIPPAEHYLDTSQQIQSNVQLNEILIDGNNKSNIELLLQKIQYINTKQLPTIGRRNIEVRTTVSCPNKKVIRLPTMETYIMVQQQITTSAAGAGAPTDATVSANNNYVNAAAAAAVNVPDVATINDNGDGIVAGTEILIETNKLTLNDEQKPQIKIFGNQNHLITYSDIKNGVNILADINITIQSYGGIINTNLQKLDSCSVNVFPSLNPDHENITIINNNNDNIQLSNKFDIKIILNKDGVELIGSEYIKNYLIILKSLIYTNKKPAYYLNRVFKLSCTQIYSHFHSGDFTLTLTVLHPKQQPTVGTIVKQQSAVIQQSHEPNMFAHAMIHSHDIQEPSAKIHNVTQKAAQSFHSTMLIIVICVSFVVLICGVGIARLRSNSHNRNTDKHQPCPKVAPEQQLDWDDSALTITINPMQNGGGGASDDSSDSENSDSDDDEATNGRYRNVSQLEWDNSTM